MKTSILLLALMLAGCGAWDRGVAQLSGSAETCIDGVMYMQFASGVTVKYLPDGRIATCQ